MTKHPLLRGWRSYHKPPKIDVDHDVYLERVQLAITAVFDVAPGIRNSLLEHLDTVRLYNGIVRADRDFWRNLATAFGFGCILALGVLGYSILIGDM